MKRPPSKGRGLAVAAGLARGLRLKVPAGIRPTGGRLRESLFDLWGERVRGARVLDLFAGSGAVGIEAVSRGAALAVLVEGDRKVFAALERNTALLTGAPPGARPVGDLRPLLVRLPGALSRLAGEEPFDLVFADPPYGFEAWCELLAAAAPLVAASGELVLEHAWRDSPARSAAESLPVESLALLEVRRYGDSALSRYQPLGSVAGVAEVGA